MVKNQKGLGALETLLVLILIAVIGAGGWLVYKHQHKTTPKTSASSSTKPPPKSTISIPAGFQKYEDKDLNITFAYPQTWGDLSIKTLNAYTSNGAATPIEGVVGGYHATFSKNSDVSLRAISKSNVHTPYGEADPYLGSGFCVQGSSVLLEEVNLTPLPEKDGIVDYKSDGPTCSRSVTLIKELKANRAYVVKVACSGGCTDYLMALSKIQKVKNIDTIVFVSTDVSQADALTQILVTVQSL